MLRSTIKSAPTITKKFTGGNNLVILDERRGDAAPLIQNH
jgi:hypothetical protein